tara:strand:+ start:303 stop:647 length:345 start_codon:yes stop_codon:yes gene_type:complete
MRFLPSLFWSFIIAFLLLSPKGELPSVKILGIDLIAHFGLFGILALLLKYDWHNYKPDASKGRLYNIFAIAFTFGIILEILQPLISNRDAELSDILANFTGISLAIIISKVTKK